MWFSRMAVNSTNSTLNDSATYIFAPVDHTIKIIIACAYAIAAVYALIANSLIFYFTQRKPTRKSAFNRSFLIDRFIQSLALSDILASLACVPVFVAEMFVDFVKTDLICKIVRFNNMYFVIATMMNYLIIGVERYIGVFYPLRVPSVKVGKRLVFVAWILAVVLDATAQVSYKLVRFELPDNMYTLTCKYDNSTKLYRNFYLICALLVYVIPCIFLAVTSIRIFKYLRRKKSTGAGDTNNPRDSRAKQRRHKATHMFLSLIFAFVIPYLVYLLYSAGTMIFKPQFSFTQDYITRYITSYLPCINGAIGASILFYNSRYHRRKLLAMFRKVLRTRTRNRIWIVNK